MSWRFQALVIVAWDFGAWVGASLQGKLCAGFAHAESDTDRS